VPFTESWGVPDLPSSAEQRHYVQAMYHLTKTLDPTRPVIGNDGWEHVATDIVALHDYENNTDVLERRYEAREELAGYRQHGRRVQIEGFEHEGKPVMLTEFGGIAWSDDPAHSWGYVRVRSSAELAARYERLLRVIHAVPFFAGFCYTQFADTYQEANGLLFADRTPKFPLEQMKAITRGPRPRFDQSFAADWQGGAQPL
jgi:hypothetical protein